MAKVSKNKKINKKAMADAYDAPVLDSDLDESEGSEHEASDLDKEVKKYEKKSFKALIDQIETEFIVAQDFIRPKWDEWAIRLKLYNNQRRDKAAIGDPLLFSIHQTVLASLYDDKLGITFSARERGDEETADNLTGLAEFDYDEMEKSELDYYWDWDTTFFGRGLVLLMDFDRTLKCPVPLQIDPFTFYRDPRAVSVRGDLRGKGSLRFCGFEERMTKNEMRDCGVYFNLDQLKKADNSYNSIIDQNRELRNQAQGRGESVDSRYTLRGENQEFRVLVWFTHYQGKKVMVHLANDRKTVIRYTELPEERKWFPIIDRACFPISKDWDGVSIPDLVEDKQRARSVAQNLALKSIKSNLHPKYLFNSDKVKKTYLQKEEINKHIPVDGDPAGAIVPVSTQAVQTEVNWILGILDTAAQRATATPEILQGNVGRDKRTATEIEKVSRGSDTRYSLAVKIWGWSEKRFWSEWYWLYDYYFAEDIDEKNIRINGASSPRWRKLRRGDIISNVSPDVMVESKILADAKRQLKLQGYTNFLNLALSYPAANKLFALRELGFANGVPRDLVYLVLPETQDEMLAREENKKLDSDERVDVGAYDDHLVHIELHNRAAETPAKFAHIEAHKAAMRIKQARPDLFPQVPSEQVPDASVSEKMSSSPDAPDTSGRSTPAYAGNPIS